MFLPGSYSVLFLLTSTSCFSSYTFLFHPFSLSPFPSPSSYLSPFHFPVSRPRISLSILFNRHYVSTLNICLYPLALLTCVHVQIRKKNINSPNCHAALTLLPSCEKSSLKYFFVFFTCSRSGIRVAYGLLIVMVHWVFLPSCEKLRLLYFYTSCSRLTPYFL